MYPAASFDFDLGFSLHASERERGRFRTMDFLSMLSALPTELQSTLASHGLCDAGIFYRTVSKHSDDLSELTEVPELQVALRGMIEAAKRKGEEHRHELATRAPECFVDEKKQDKKLISISVCALETPSAKSKEKKANSKKREVFLRTARDDEDEKEQKEREFWVKEVAEYLMSVDVPAQPDGIRYPVAFGDGGTYVWAGVGVDTQRVYSALEEFHTMVDRSGVIRISKRCRSDDTLL